MKQSTESTRDYSQKYITLGSAIAHYRKAKGLTQEQLAKQVQISRQHLGAIEAPHMTRAVSLELLFALAEVLEVEPYLLLKFPRF